LSNKSNRFTVSGTDRALLQTYALTKPRHAQTYPDTGHHNRLTAACRKILMVYQNPTSRFGKPPFSAARITIGAENPSIEIMLE
jgi:hypothetical protein